MYTDAEIKNSFSITLDTLHHILRVAFTVPYEEEESSTRLAYLYRDELLSFYEKHPNDVFATLVDTSSIGDGTHMVSKEAREIYQDLINHQQTGKVAIVAGAGLFSFLSKFIIGLFVKRKNVQFFTDKTVAVAWLVAE